MNQQKNAVQIYLRIKGPLLASIKPQFKIHENDTKIRFVSADVSEQQNIMDQFAGVGYKYEKIFREDSKQEDIYAKVAQDLVQSAFEGYNGTIFAYGQTGSGKTYTMTGSDDDPTQMGIIPRVIDQLYKQAEVRQEQVTIKLKYMQIYKQFGYDLLNPANKSKKLQQLVQVKPFAKGDNFEFQNLSEHEAVNFEAALQIYEKGDENRIICKTPSNDQSSRSHCIFMIGVKTKNRDTGLQQKAYINLVDLAGSQRVHNSGMESKQAEEGISINLGLYYLSRVVLALGEQSQTTERVHVPYRDSLLTMALKSSIGGNCKTRMIATINPNPANTPQNIATCRFSQNLLCMKNKLKKNQFINPWDIIKGLKNEIQELKGQISRLKGEDVKEVLEREDYTKIYKMVDNFITSQNAVQTLPINDRLYIREYLSYMRSIIKKLRTKNGNANEIEANKHQAGQVSQHFVYEMKKLRQQIQQKQNQIQLLLTLINNKKQENPEDIEENLLCIEDNNEKKIAQTVINSLNKGRRKKPLNITVEQVQKNLLKPIKLNKQDSVQQAFQKFKNAHVKTEDINEKDHDIRLKQMKKDVAVKKIKKLKYERVKVHQKIQQIQKRNGSTKPNQLPNLQDCNGISIEQELSNLKNELVDIDEKLKKRYQQIKTIQLEISRLSLCKNKNVYKMQTEFNEYINNSRSRKNSQSSQQGTTQSKVETFEEIKRKIKEQKQDRSSRKQSAQMNRNLDDKKKQNEQEDKVSEQQVDKHMQQFFKARQKLKQNLNCGQLK